MITFVRQIFYFYFYFFISLIEKDLSVCKRFSQGLGVHLQIYKLLSTKYVDLLYTISASELAFFFGLLR